MKEDEIGRVMIQNFSFIIGVLSALMLLIIFPSVFAIYLLIIISTIYTIINGLLYLETIGKINIGIIDKE